MKITEYNWKVKLLLVLLSLQFALDSSIYLTSVVGFLEWTVAKPGVNIVAEASHWLFVIQAASAAVQIVASFAFGVVAKYVRSVKYCISACFLVSFGGNFLYSCGGPGSLKSIGAILAGRVLTGLGSASAAGAYAYISNLPFDKRDISNCFFFFRNSAGITMGLSQVVVIGLSYVKFNVGSYEINEYNASTFVTSFVILVAGILLGIFLDNEIGIVPPESPDFKVEEMDESNTDSQEKITQKSLWEKVKDEPSRYLFVPGNILFVSATSLYIMSSVSYYFPLFYTVIMRYGPRDQGIAFIIVALTAIAVSILLQYCHGIIRSTLYGDNYHSNTFKIQAEFAIISYATIIAGVIIMIAVWESIDTKQSHHSIGIAAGFTIGLILAFTGYNTQASSVPVLFKESIPDDTRTVAMPLSAAFQGIGKLLGPIISDALYNTKPSYGIGFGFILILSVLSFVVLVSLSIRNSRI